MENTRYQPRTFTRLPTHQSSYRTGVGLRESERHPAVTWKRVDGHMSKIARVLVDFAVRPLGYVSARENEAAQ